MNTLVPTIGLEIHAELNTHSKMFCGCANDPDASAPNIHVCPVCMAHPGTLPVINEEAVFQVLRVGTALGGSLADFTEFDRKNYYYPDIPKSYQISQYAYPLVTGGTIGPVTITRIHLEEDTARSSHGTESSVVDFNRAGVPLMELVTEPVIHDADTAVSFARDLRLLLRYLDASRANLEKGEMRIEANISVAPKGATLGTKVEVKNLNSFKAVEQAIAYEIKRQTEALAHGETLRQETRGWDENRQKTFSQRAKESSHDYRYFPDPDLPKLTLSEIPKFSKENIDRSIPELPWNRRKRYTEQGVATSVAEVLVGDLELNRLYEGTLSHLDTIDDESRALVANYLTTDLLGIQSKKGSTTRPTQDLEAKELAQLILLIRTNAISSRGAKDALAIWAKDGGDFNEITKKHNLLQVSDESTLRTVIEKIVVDNTKVVEEYRQGKEAALQFLIGQGMKMTKGSADPVALKTLIVEIVNEK
jgi:aspartyl-tRNA(Asn)/glutamyl-tRNA(Gln) amidotransferase subunit B